MLSEKYALLEESLQALQKNSINLLCLCGAAGFGKSYTTMKYLEDHNADYAYFNTYSSPLAFYKNLYLNKDKNIIIFDDIQNLDNPVIIAILKAACWGILDNKRVVGWHTTSETFYKLGVDEDFILNANLILIFNDTPKGFEPIINRSINIEFNFTYQEKLQIFQGLNLDPEILAYVKANCSEATENLSIRTIKILEKLKTDGFDWPKFAKEMLKNNEYGNELVKLVSKYHETKTICEEWINATGKSRASFFRLKKKLNL